MRLKSFWIDWFQWYKINNFSFCFQLFSKQQKLYASPTVQKTLKKHVNFSMIVYWYILAHFWSLCFGNRHVYPCRKCMMIFFRNCLHSASEGIFSVPEERRKDRRSVERFPPWFTRALLQLGLYPQIADYTETIVEGGVRVPNGL